MYAKGITLFILLFLTGCAVHQAEVEPTYEKLIFSRQEKLEKRVGELSQRIENVERDKSIAVGVNKQEQLKLFLGIVFAIVSVLILINVIVENFGKYIASKLPWRKKKCDPK